MSWFQGKPKTARVRQEIAVNMSSSAENTPTFRPISRCCLAAPAQEEWRPLKHVQILCVGPQLQPFRHGPRFKLEPVSRFDVGW